MPLFEKELNYFIRNQDSLVKKYHGKVLVIVGESVLGAFDSLRQADTAAQKQHQPGTYMLQQCEPGAAAYTVTISTLGLFA